jgi:hypothetical protein
MNRNIIIAIAGLLYATWGLIGFLSWPPYWFSDLLYPTGIELNFIIGLIVYKPIDIFFPFPEHGLELVVAILLLVESTRFLLRGKGLTMISFLFCVIYVGKIGLLLRTIFALLFKMNYGESPVITIVSGGIAFYIFMLSFNQLTRNNYITKENSAAKKTRRFLGFFVDISIIVFILSPIDLSQQFVSRLILIVFFFLYYYFMEYYLKITPGKLLLRTRVVSEDHTELTAVVIFKRTLLRLVPFESLSFLGKKGFHDKFSKTKVVNITQNV